MGSRCCGCQSVLESDSASFTRSDEGYFVKTEMRAVRKDFEN